MKARALVGHGRVLSRGGVGSDLCERAQMCHRVREGLLEEESPLGGMKYIGEGIADRGNNMHKGPGP